MIKRIRQSYEIELNVKERGILTQASSILEEILNSASDQGVNILRMDGGEEYSLKEFSQCLFGLIDIEASSGHITGYSNTQEF